MSRTVKSKDGDYEVPTIGEAYYEIQTDKNNAIVSNWIGDGGKIGLNWAKKETRRLQKLRNVKLHLVVYPYKPGRAKRL